MFYADTQILRATVSQEIRQILGTEEGVPGRYREVQLLMPDSPVTYVAIGKGDEELGVQAGLNRTYKLPVVPPGAQVTIRLLPHQTLWAAAESGISRMTLVVEYMEK